MRGLYITGKNKASVSYVGGDSYSANVKIKTKTNARDTGDLSDTEVDSVDECPQLRPYWEALEWLLCTDTSFHDRFRAAYSPVLRGLYKRAESKVQLRGFFYDRKLKLKAYPVLAALDEIAAVTEGVLYIEVLIAEIRRVVEESAERARKQAETATTAVGDIEAWIGAAGLGKYRTQEGVSLASILIYSLGLERAEQLRLLTADMLAPYFQAIPAAEIAQKARQWTK